MRPLGTASCTAAVVCDPAPVGDKRTTRRVGELERLCGWRWGLAGLKRIGVRARGEGMLIPRRAPPPSQDRQLALQHMLRIHPTIAAEAGLHVHDLEACTGGLLHQQM